MKGSIVVAGILLMFFCLVDVFADKLPKVAYFNIPKGRSIESQTAINKISNNKGVVAVNFVINNKGKVTSAMVDLEHTTVKDKIFVKKVVKAVLSTRFNNSFSAPEKQNGSLAYVFN